MKKGFSTVVWVVVLALVLVLPRFAKAAVITTGVWSPVDTSQVNRDGSHFWDNLSWDGAGCNAGELLAGANCGGRFGGVGLNVGLHTLEYLHDGKGGAVSFQFQNMESATYLGGVTAREAENESWISGAGTHGPLFGRTALPGDTYDLTTVGGQAYGLVYTPSPMIGYMTTHLADTDQFVLFKVETPLQSIYFVGVEDIFPVEYDAELRPIQTFGDWDFNDAIYKFVENKLKPGTPIFYPPIVMGWENPVQCVPVVWEDEICGGLSYSRTPPPTDPPSDVPEPTSLLLLGVGLLAGVRRSYQKH